MRFEPIILNNLFSPEDHQKLKSLIENEKAEKNWNDKWSNRNVKKYNDLEGYFSKLLEPAAMKIFSDKTLKTSYSAYLDYNRPQSKLSPHKDTNACTYTIDYCISAKTPWGVVVEGEEYVFGEGQGLAFMGGYDSHWRNDMPDPENNRVEMAMFHFCPEDHWYFTEGQDYLYELDDKGLLENLDVDSYELSPEYIRKHGTK